MTAYLKEAMNDLAHVREDAKEERWQVPGDSAIATAERVFNGMFNYAPRPYAIYAMPGGEIAVDAHSPHGCKVVVVCGPSGGARCLVYFNGESDSREYDDPSALPDDFVKDALRKSEYEKRQP